MGTYSFPRPERNNHEAGSSMNQPMKERSSMSLVARDRPLPPKVSEYNLCMSTASLVNHLRGMGKKVVKFPSCIKKSEYKR